MDTLYVAKVSEDQLSRLGNKIPYVIGESGQKILRGPRSFFERLGVKIEIQPDMPEIIPANMSNRGVERISVPEARVGITSSSRADERARLLKEKEEFIMHQRAAANISDDEEDGDPDYSDEDDPSDDAWVDDMLEMVGQKTPAHTQAAAPRKQTAPAQRKAPVPSLSREITRAEAEQAKREYLAEMEASDNAWADSMVELATGSQPEEDAEKQGDDQVLGVLDRIFITRARG